MGIKSFFNSLFGHHEETDGPMPLSLGKGSRKNPVVYKDTDNQQSSPETSSSWLVENKPEAPKADSTEAPKVDSTEALEDLTKKVLEDLSTESPKADSTEDPKSDSTDAPKANSNEAPKADSTEDPKADSTEAPKVDSTEDPKADSTDAPKDDSTEDNKTQEEKVTIVNSTYNLIILDESGSMYNVRYKTIDGCNETLNSIRNIAKEQPHTKQFVSIFCFDTTNSRYIFKNMPIEKTRDLKPADYLPNCCTPLYDAIGYTVTQLRQLIDHTESVGVVTIITDGYENASSHWNHNSVVELIDSLKKRGWVFTFIGANIDVERTARGLGIDSHITFQQTDEGMDKMFKQERCARVAYNEKMSYLRQRPMYDEMSKEARRTVMYNMNSNFFIEDERVAPNIVRTLSENAILVFGSNISGQHNDGYALYAKQRFGAIDGQPEGIQGQCYAIPVYGNSFEELKAAIVRFTDYAVTHPQNKFMLSAIGCGGSFCDEKREYEESQIAPLFRRAYSFGNVYVPASFLPYVSSQTNSNQRQ